MFFKNIFLLFCRNSKSKRTYFSLLDKTALVSANCASFACVFARFKASKRVSNRIKCFIERESMSTFLKSILKENIKEREFHICTRKFRAIANFEVCGKELWNVLIS